ncbi:hypothetical protein TSUD_159280 [Trifolium subterraneum]|uniref:non-specific serine/threonine protein kinase n=1 Tax=Trifolium subterraneum TaxID=3900 RepID=A0A2Z6NG87_TRISU|nr:hypothetical protein TSUD_159280 [Trifolium subterraneum]
MSIFDGAFINTQLSKHTSIFGLRLWVVIGILIGVVIVFILFLISLCVVSRRRHRRTGDYKITGATPAKEIQEIVHIPGPHMLRRPTPAKVPEIHVDIGRQEHRVVVKSDRVSSGESKGTVGSGCETTSSFGSGSVGGIGPEVSHLGWGRWYTLRELEDATGGLCPENVLGEGGYGIVYHGVLTDGTKVAVKNLLNNKGQAEKEFKVEVEAIGRVRHKNLVRLLGYCVEGAYRMLVYEYVDNGNLEQWLHGDVGPVNLIEWLKTMVGNRKAEEVVDPKLPEMPSSKALKRALLIALRCVDPDATKRPKMGHVIHMLEADDLLFHNDRKTGGESSRSLNDFQQEHEDSNLEKRTNEGISVETEHGSARNNYQSTRGR